MKRVTVTVDPDNYEVLDQLARRSDFTASWLIPRSMREFLERHAEDRRIEVRPGGGGA